MKELSVSQTKDMYAGAISAGVIAGIWAALSFVVGIFDGYSRPFKCR